MSDKKPLTPVQLATIKADKEVKKLTGQLIVKNVGSTKSKR